MKETGNYKANPGQKRLSLVLRNDLITRLLAFSGSRSGKTFEFVRSLIARSILSKNSRHVVIRKYFRDAKRFIWLDTLPKVIDICYPEIKKQIKRNNSDYYIRFPNRSELWIGGLDDKERADKILGGEYNTIYFNEVSEISYNSVVTALTRLAMKNYKEEEIPLINKAYFDCNPPLKAHWSYKLFFDHVDPITGIEIKNKSNYAKVHLMPEDNIANLPEQYIEELKNLPGKARTRFYDGIYSEAAEGALWSQAIINKFRVNEVPELARIVIPIDPAVTSGESSHETGIVPVGLGINGHIYVLDDISGTYTPNEWGSRAILAYDRWEADSIVGEVNQGGDMVETIIHNIRNNVGFLAVRATRGKYKRAEPVSQLYERGLVHHVGELPDLEYQMVFFEGQPEDENNLFDRMDALVWGITALITTEDEEDTEVYEDRVRISNI